MSQNSDFSFTLSNGRIIGGKAPCLIIAEIGQNHQGSLEMAKQMIKMVKDAGADVAKFQKSTLEAKFNHRALDRTYNGKNSFGQTYREHKEYLEFSFDDFKELQRYADEIGIIFTASGMDIPAFDFLAEIQVPFVKVGSGDTNNLQLIEHVAQKKLPMIISSGMNDMESVQKTMDVALEHNDRLCLLQCTSSYPLPDNEVHLNVLKSYQEKYGDRVVIGYSGHETGIGITVAAVALGAKVVERHVTMNKSWKGTDHPASLQPEELRQLCTEIRRVEQALGHGEKRIQPSEMACHQKLGKSIVSRTRLSVGQILEKSHLTVKVADPKGINPNQYYDLIGRKVKRTVDIDEPILEKDLF